MRRNKIRKIPAFGIAFPAALATLVLILALSLRTDLSGAEGLCPECGEASLKIFFLQTKCLRCCFE